MTLNDLAGIAAGLILVVFAGFKFFKKSSSEKIADTAKKQVNKSAAHLRLVANEQHDSNVKDAEERVKTINAAGLTKLAEIINERFNSDDK